MSLSEAVKHGLAWWTDNVMQAFRQLRHPDISYIFQTDASDRGWGITCTTNPNLQYRAFGEMTKAPCILM